MYFILFDSQVLFHSLQHKKPYKVKCSTLEELIREARVVFEIAEESKVFIQGFDELWMEKIDVKSLNDVNDRDKLK